MSDNLPDRLHLTDLSLDDRAQLSYELFMAWATKGSSYRSLALEKNMDPRSVKTLIDEHAAFERNNGSDTKMGNFNAYRWLMGKAQEIIECDHFQGCGHSALLQAKAYEAYIQSLTRMDKLGGHEAPTMQGTIPGETVADLIRKAYSEGGFSDISPTDHGIVDMEIVDDDSSDVRPEEGPY